MTEEVWRDVSGFGLAFAARYQVSDIGRVRCSPKVSGVVGCKPGAIRTLSKSSDGYLKLMLCVGGEKKYTSAHRLVALAFLGDPPSSLHQVNHLDGDKTNNRVSNLEWATPESNARHACTYIQKKTTIHVHGEAMTVEEAVERFAPPGLSARSVVQRIRKLGWQPLHALLVPPLKSGRQTKGSLEKLFASVAIPRAESA